MPSEFRVRWEREGRNPTYRIYQSWNAAYRKVLAVQAIDAIKGDTERFADMPDLVAVPEIQVREATRKKQPCLYPLSDGRRCCECATCYPVASDRSRSDARMSDKTIVAWALASASFEKRAAGLVAALEKIARPGEEFGLSDEMCRLIAQTALDEFFGKSECAE